MAATSSPDEPNLAATSWTILGMLSYEEEVSGYDIKKWADWSISYFYWSPSFSQIYSELRKLEKIGYATSRVDHDNGARSRRLYKITAAGMAAMNQWANETPAEPQVLKHSVVLREDGTVMEGLYAIGNTAANAFGATYPGAGATIAQGLVYGYIAAQDAAVR